MQLNILYFLWDNLMKDELCKDCRTVINAAWKLNKYIKLSMQPKYEQQNRKLKHNLFRSDFVIFASRSYLHVSIRFGFFITHVFYEQELGKHPTGKNRNWVWTWLYECNSGKACVIGSSFTSASQKTTANARLCGYHHATDASHCEVMRVMVINVRAVGYLSLLPPRVDYRITPSSYETELHAGYAITDETRLNAAVFPHDLSSRMCALSRLSG